MKSLTPDRRPSHILDFEAIGRVVDRVKDMDASLGSAYELPATTNSVDWGRVRAARAGLASSISWAYTLRDVHADWTSDSRAKRRYTALERVHRMARELIALIKDDQLPLTPSLAPRFLTSDEDGFHVVDFSQLMVGLERLQEAAKQERARLSNADLHEAAPLSRVGGDSASLATPGNAFISRMGEVFEEGFGQEVLIKFTSDREPTGPFVSFVEAVTREMGEPMTAEGTRKAWDRAKVHGQSSEEK